MAITRNGHFPPGSLGDIPGPNAGLERRAAAAYRAMDAHSRRRYGVSLAITDGAVGRTARSYARQLMAKRIYGSNAATPGFSNHGWARATDLMTRQQRWAVDQIGAPYGFAKRWSDASWEWWHIKWRAGVWRGASSATYPTLRYRSRNTYWVKRAQKALGYLGYLKAGTQTGFYGKQTRSAVKRLQKRWGYKADGVLGPKTWRLLRNRCIAKRK